MIRPRLRGRCFWVGLFASPGLIWALMLILTPTGWAKNRLIGRLEAATGRSVRIGSVHLGIFGHLKIFDLSFAEARTPANPWLTIRETKVDVHLGQLLIGCCQPGDVVVEGASLRVWRRANGQFEFGDLARPGPSPTLSAKPAPSSLSLVPAVNVQVNNSQIRFADDPNNFRADLTAITARGAYKAQEVRVEDLRGQINGGSLTIAAQLIRDPSMPRFSFEVQGKSIHLDHGLEMVEDFVPLVARADDAIGGTLNVRLALKGQGNSCPEVRKSLTGHGSILLDPIDLDGSRIFEELQALGDWPNANHVASVSSSFQVGQSRISTEDLTIRASALPFVVAGWTDFDGRFAYETRVDQMIARLPKEARHLLGELKVNVNELTGLRIEGYKDLIRLSLNGRPLSSDPKQPIADRTRYRDTARKIHDRFFR